MKAARPGAFHLAEKLTGFAEIAGVFRASRNSRRNRRDSTRTGRKKPGRQPIHRRIRGRCRRRVPRNGYGVIKKILPPGMEDPRRSRSPRRDASDRGRWSAELRRPSGRECRKPLRIMKSDAGDLFRDGEDDVKIFRRQQFGLPAAQPFRPFRRSGISDSGGYGRSCRRGA